MPFTPNYIPSLQEAAVARLCCRFDHADWWKIYRKFVAAYRTPRRYYHTLNGHIGKCLREFRQIEKKLTDPEALIAELLGHDAIMEFGRSDNDERSAEWTSALLREIGAPESFCSRVADGIATHAHRSVPASEDGRYALDIDLAILGARHWEFWLYERNIRKEYAFVPEEIFRIKRAEVLQEFLERPEIYHTEFFHGRYESRARQNLEWSISRLLKK